MKDTIAPYRNGVSFDLQPELSKPDPLTTSEKVKKFLTKYLLEGQKFHDDDGSGAPRLLVIPEGADSLEVFVMKHRKLLGVVIGQAFMFILWLICAVRFNFFPLYEKWWHMTLIMIAGTMIGGMTCEGSGAVTFPIMTLLLHIAPDISRDFIYMSQSVGITNAAFAILFMGVAVEWHSIIFSSIGSSFGLIIGIEYVAPRMSKEQKKMYFVSIWFAFACALYLLNRMKKRKVYMKIQLFTWWKALILVATGYVGGTLTSFGGTGACICSFSILTLCFSISEKIATQTSIVLMAGQTLLAFFWRAVIDGTISDTSYEIIKCTWVVSAVGGPIGGLVGSYVHRQFLACCVYFLEITALIGGFLVVQPGFALTLTCIGIIIGMFMFFYGLSKYGLYLLSTYPDQQPGYVRPIPSTAALNVRVVDDAGQPKVVTVS